MTTDISNSADIIDIRDVIERVEHLEQLRQPGPVDLGEDDNEMDQDTLFAEVPASIGSRLLASFKQITPAPSMTA